jgi:hypothetical protein
MADRWFNGLDGGSFSFSRQAFSAGDTLGSNNPTYFARASVSGQSLASSQFNVAQAVESVRSYAGQTITVLGWARRSSGSGNMTIEGRQAFGTGGSPSSEVTGISPTTITLASSWTPFAATMSIPSITGKTLGTTTDGALVFTFWLSAGSNFNARTNSLGIQTIGVDLWGVHIKVGTHTTAAAALYKQPELGPELARCQRYYEKSYNVDVVPGTNTSVGQVAFGGSTQASGFMCIPVSFKVTKRSAPVVAFWAVTTPGSWVYSRSGGSGFLAMSTISIGQSGFGASSAITGAAWVSAVIEGQWAADAEL